MKMFRVSGRAMVSICLLAAVACSSEARADWDPGDPAKWVQLPDPNGLDVNFTNPKVLADDFLCTLTGPITDVHFWFSSRQDQPFTITNIHVSFHADIPAGGEPPYSHPGTLLWQRDFNPGQFTIRPYGSGQQGWYDPNMEFYNPLDHSGIWQANIVNIVNPFVQQQGTIYWLDISVMTQIGELGWKTSFQHFNDDAVWGDFPSPIWQELRHPETNESLDLAFALTTIPEPSAILLVALGGMGLWVLRRRR